MRNSREDGYQRPTPVAPGARMSNRTPPWLVRRYGLILAASLLVTFVILRGLLFISPDSDFNVMGHNIHHLFTGLVLIVLGGVPLAIFRGHSRKVELALLVFGVGLGMALDEWVYLIATDGSNASYLLPVSFWGGVTVIAVACLYILGLVALRLARTRARSTLARSEP